MGKKFGDKMKERYCLKKNLLYIKYPISALRKRGIIVMNKVYRPGKVVKLIDGGCVAFCGLWFFIIPGFFIFIVFLFSLFRLFLTFFKKITATENGIRIEGFNPKDQTYVLWREMIRVRREKHDLVIITRDNERVRIRNYGNTIKELLRDIADNAPNIKHNHGMRNSLEK